MKRRKLYHFCNLISDGINFYHFEAVKDNSGNRGTRFLLSDPLTDSQKEKLYKYDNVIISNASYRYAPEIKRDTIILLK